MFRFFSLMSALYTAEYRAEFGDEMRAVLKALAESGGSVGLGGREFFGLLRGALSEHCRLLPLRPAFSMVCGALLAFGTHLLMYWTLVPGKTKTLQRVVEELASRVFLMCLIAGICLAQPAPKPDAGALELAKSIYSRSFADVRDAKTLEDMHKISDRQDSKDWISLDRFGRTVLTMHDTEGVNREFASMLSLPPERRVGEMDIIWAERDSDRLMVLAWIMPHEVEVTDAESGGKHRLMEGTLIRDLFQKTADGWVRFQHDKLTPNSMILAVDGSQRIVPPMDERNRVTPSK
jgi:hypothetical protein